MLNSTLIFSHIPPGNNKTNTMPRKNSESTRSRLKGRSTNTHSVYSSKTVRLREAMLESISSPGTSNSSTLTEKKKKKKKR